MPAIIDENTQYIDPDTSAPILNGKVFYGEEGSDPETSEIEVFSDRAMTPANVVPQPVRTDASGRTIPSPLFTAARYSFIVKTSGDEQKLINLFAGQTQVVGIVSLTNITGTGNAIVADADPPIGAPLNGQQFTLTAVSINTDKMTIEIDTSGPKPLKFNFNEEMAPGFIQAKTTLNFTYNSTEDAYFWINEGRGISLLSNVAGDGNTITADGGPSTTGYIDGQKYQFEPNVTNTGAVKLKVGDLPELSIKSKGIELVSGQLVVGKTVEVVFNSTASPDEFELLNLNAGVLQTTLDTSGFSINESQGAAVASATKPNIWAGDGNTIHITGTTQIDDFTDAPRIGARVTLIFDAILILKNGSGITLPGAVDITTAVGDRFEVYADAVDAFSGVYIRNSGLPLQSFFGNRLLHVEDVKSNGTAGGTFTAGSSQIRTLNTVRTNEISGASLSNSQVTLPAGTYYAEAKAPAFRVNQHRIQLFDFTASLVLIQGTNSLTGPSDTTATISPLSGRFTITSTKVIVLHHRGTTTKNVDGFGSPCTFGDSEIYAVLKIWQIL